MHRQGCAPKAALEVGFTKCRLCATAVAADMQCFLQTTKKGDGVWCTFFRRMGGRSSVVPCGDLLYLWHPNASQKHTHRSLSLPFPPSICFLQPSQTPLPTATGYIDYSVPSRSSRKASPRTHGWGVFLSEKKREPNIKRRANAATRTKDQRET